MCNRSRARSPTPWLESPLQPPSFHPWSALASTSSSRHAPLSRRTKRWPPPSCGRRCLAPHHAGTGAPTPTHPSISDGPAPYRRRHGGHQLALHLPGLRAASPAQAGRPRPDIPCPRRTTGAPPLPPPPRLVQVDGLLQRAQHGAKSPPRRRAPLNPQAPPQAANELERRLLSAAAAGAGAGDSGARTEEQQPEPSGPEPTPSSSVGVGQPGTVSSTSECHVARAPDTPAGEK